MDAFDYLDNVDLNEEVTPVCQDPVCPDSDIVGYDVNNNDTFDRELLHVHEQPSATYQPICSDISDDDDDQKHLKSRFCIPISDAVVATKSRKRYVAMYISYYLIKYMKSSNHLWKTGKY